jgi:tetratricopeptide (TPR) repeat protein
VTARRQLAAALLLAAVIPAAAVRRAAAADPALAALEQRAKAFYNLLASGERQKAAATWPGLERDLAAASDRLRTTLDDMREAVMERDGDLEELYRSPRWREPEIGSLVITYHLAWVRYHGAALSEPAKRKPLLQKAVEGFSQFLLVNEVPDIYAESLYGRGLAFMELGEYAKATEDLTAAAGESSTAGKAKAALEEARRRAQGKKAPAAEDPEALLARLTGLLKEAAGGDAKVEAQATELARGLAVRGGDWPARVVAAVTGALGDGTPGGVRSSYGLFLLAQLAVDRGRCADIPPLAEAVTKVNDAGSARHRPEIQFLDAGCLLNAGKQREAAERFAALVEANPDGPRAREAAYYRVRALDVARTQDASLTAAYEQAIDAYLTRFPKTDAAGEVRFLLGELRRSQGDCARAEAEYARVGEGAFRERAALGALECRVAELGDKKPSDRAAVLAGLRSFVSSTKDRKLAARASLLAAAVASSATPPDNATVIELLDGFEERYPDAKELHPRALELRLVARVQAGRLDGVEKDLDAFLRDGAEDAQKRGTLTRLARALTTRALRAPAGGDDRIGALARTVQARLLAETKAPADRVTLAELELHAGHAAAARKLYEEALAADAGSQQALRGAARASAAAGDPDAALQYWARVLDGSTPGGTAWYEARLAQVTVLADSNRRPQACQVLRSSRGRATSAGADQLDARLRSMESEVCQ